MLEYLGLEETVSLAEKVRELDGKHERIARELGRIEKDLAYVMRTVGQGVFRLSMEEARRILAPSAPSGTW